MQAASSASVTPAALSFASRSSVVVRLPMAPTYPAFVRRATWSSGTSNLVVRMRNGTIAARSSTGRGEEAVKAVDRELVDVEAAHV